MSDEARVERLLEALTVEEKVALAGGADTWRTAAVPRLGIGALTMTDGPAGARGGGFGGVTSACAPCGTALGASWDPALVEEVAGLLGEEARRKGAAMLLAPTINLHRHPLGGRMFECPSEDPHLAAAFAAAFVRGVQARGVAATPKHYVANDSEVERMSISSEVGERALREVYLRPFEAAVEAGAWAVMAAYNRVNGEHASEHAPLLQGILKDEWGFDGVVVSDWWGTKSTVPSALGGLDLEMPGPPIHFGERLAAAVEAGEVPRAVLDEMARRVLRLLGRTGALDGSHPARGEQAVDLPEDRALLRRAVAAGAVLLHNDGVLPLWPTAPGRQTLALVGPAARRLAPQGGGSARVEPHRNPELAPLLEARLAALGHDVEVVHEEGCRLDVGVPALELEGAGAEVEYYGAAGFDGPVLLRHGGARLELKWLGDPAPGIVEGRFSVRATGTFQPVDTGPHRLSLVCSGQSRLLLDGEVVLDLWDDPKAGPSYYGMGTEEITTKVDLEAGRDYAVAVEYRSPARGFVLGVRAGLGRPADPGAMDRAAALAARADVVVVVAGSNSDFEREGEDRASLHLPGLQDDLIARCAAANPRTVVVLNAGSPLAMPWAADVAAVLDLWYPGQEGADALVDLLVGDAEPGGRLPTTFPYRVDDSPAHLTYPGDGGTVSYGEGVLIGHRGLRKNGIAPRFCFGHGLSYTTFDIGAPTITATDAGFVLELDVANTGHRAGTHVVQAYLEPPPSSLLRPDRSLVGFAKVALARTGVTTARIEVPWRELAAWDPRVGGLVVEAGDHRFHVGSSLLHTPHVVSVTVEEPRPL